MKVIIDKRDDSFIVYTHIGAGQVRILYITESYSSAVAHCMKKKYKIIYACGKKWWN